MKQILKPFLCLLVSICVMGGKPVYAEEGFAQWVKDFKVYAYKEGIGSGVLEQALADLSFLPRVIELDRKQPEGRLTYAQYRTKIVSNLRIKRGRALYRQHYDALKRIGDAYGVQPQYIVALWGIETNYGRFTGGTHTLSALATLAYEGRRQKFFTSELMKALQIIQQGHVSAKDMKGSWAGALGQNQFMPSSFLAYAVDHDGDGRKDIWGTHEDVFASTANYLAKRGWRGDERWGRPVTVPTKGIDKDTLGTKVTRSLEYWRQKGVRTLQGSPIPVAAGINASLLQPDGPGTQAYLGYNNYHTLLKWNRSVYFATSVGLIADAIASSAPKK